MPDSRLPDFLEFLYHRYNRPEYRTTDPVQMLYRYKGNREFIGFTAAAFAYGSVTAIVRFLDRFFAGCGTDPLALKKPSGLYYRFQSEADIASYAVLMRRIYEEYGSIEKLFLKHASGGLHRAKIGAMAEMRRTATEISGTKGLLFLLANPEVGGAKRLNMFLRWMIRSDAIDAGEWSQFHPSQLMMPVDTHILRFAANAGIVKNSHNSAKQAVAVTDFFQNLQPEDPAKYDFALTRPGICEKCLYTRTENCLDCPLQDKCAF